MAPGDMSCTPDSSEPRPEAQQSHREATSDRREKGQLTGYVYAVGFIAALGGLLFGYDTGVVSGAQQFFAPEFHLTPTTQEIAVSSVLIGAVIGAIIAGRHADWLGRRKALSCSA